MMIIRLIGPLLCGAALLTVVSASSAPAQAAGRKVCMEDDGNGRLRACSSRYKGENPNWRESAACRIDEGKGRFRPCTGER